MVRPILSFLFMSAVGVASIECETTNEEYQKRLSEMKRSGIVAGTREKTFDENYKVKVRLPMPEKQFIALLKHLKLSYELFGEVPTPLHSRSLDVSKVRRCYHVYGDARKKYRAYVDRDNRVIYIENAFTYPIP